MFISIFMGLRRMFPSMALDVGLVCFAYLLALLLRFEGEIPQVYVSAFKTGAVPIAMVYVGANYIFGLYNRFWPYASANEVGFIWGSAVLGTMVVATWDILASTPRNFPLSVVLIGGIFALGFLTVMRYRWRLVTGFLWRLRRATGRRTRVLIVGAGEAGQLLAWQLKNQTSRYEVVGFIDDDHGKIGMRVHGVRILGDRGAIVREASAKNAEIIVIAIHRITGREFREILARCQDTRAQIKVLPNILELMESKGGIPALRDIAIEDLLGRQTVVVDHETCHRLLSDKTVLVTGAAGSIGSDLSRMILNFNPCRLILLDNNESGLYDLSLQLQPLASQGVVIQTVVSDVLHVWKLDGIFALWHPEIVFHCAAYKHVPLMEEHPDEAFLVNVIGTRDLRLLAEKHGTERFVLISSDKAVAPTSIMGMTKRMGELLTLMPSQSGACLFTAVRFGNVLNSRGSVIPTFLHQIEMGGPVTVTDPQMTRFFMGPLEAVSLILEAAALTQGSDIFVLDMGEEIRIVDLAQRLIRLRGLRVGNDVEIVYSGIRPGEKLHEELIYAPHEQRVLTTHPQIFEVLGVPAPSRDKLMTEVDELAGLAQTGRAEEVSYRLNNGLATFYGPSLSPLEKHI